MKKFKNIFMGILFATVVSSTLVIPISSNAIYMSSNTSYSEEELNYFEENSISTNGIITVEFDNEYQEDYYIEVNNSTFGIDVQKIDTSFDTSNVDKHFNISIVGNNNSKYNLYVKFNNLEEEYYSPMIYDYEFDTFIILEERISIPSKNTVGDSTPITEFTVGESTYPRGDINLDGKVNTLDLLMLKKYLLGLMEW